MIAGGQLHIARSSQKRRERVEKPWDDRAAEKYLRIGDRLAQHMAPPAKQCKEMRTEDQHGDHEDQPETNSDQQRMNRKRRRPLGVVGSKRACNRGGDTAAHRAAGHCHHQNDEREHERHRGERLDTKTADVARLGNRDASTRRQRDDIGCREPQQGRKDRSIEQRMADPAPNERQRRLVVFDNRNFGNAKLGHSFPRPRPSITGSPLTKISSTEI